MAEWGGPAAIAQFAPSAADDRGVREWWARLLRSGSGPGAIRRVLEAFLDTDVRPLLPGLRVPTLVLQRRGDVLMRLAAGEYLARHIPDARLVVVEGHDHWFWRERSEEILERIGRFLAALD